MGKYNKEQSTVVALWVLALQCRSDPKAAIQDATAPPVIVEILNRLGESHSSDSILLHTHGYDRLLLGRDIDKTISKLQREVASALKDAGVVSKVYVD
jgi:hypothetical protein